MNKKILFPLLMALSLTSCTKTNLLYGENAYNSPVFDENYYVEWEGINNLKIRNQVNGLHSKLHYSAEDKVIIGDTEITNFTWGGLKDNQFGYNNNLSKIEKKFNYGITSKLFDGRVRCEQLYQKSRVQLDKSGFAMYFPKILVSTNYLGFACRGGTDFKAGEEFAQSDLKVNFTWSFYIHIDGSEEYDKVTYTLKDVLIPVDNGGNTAFVNFVPYLSESFTELYGAVAMSFEWTCVDSRIDAKNLTDDYSNKEKHHLSLMLYEVFIGDSVWY